MIIGHLTIDQQRIPFSMGQSVLDAALAAGVYIPHLCHHPDYAARGNCRLCVVEVNGRTTSACTLPASDGLQVTSHNEELQALRRGLLQLLFVEGNHICPACEVSGNCQLQALAYYCGMLEPGFAHFYPLRDLDASHPDAVIDFNRCILCELCVRASRDADGKAVFAIAGRGKEAHLVINSPSGLLGDSAFAGTDKAAHICPVGAILPRGRAYSVPVGERLYDQKPINLVGDKADHQHD